MPWERPKKWQKDKKKEKKKRINFGGLGRCEGAGSITTWVLGVKESSVELVAQIQSLAQELPYCHGCSHKKKKKLTRGKKRCSLTIKVCEWSDYLFLMNSQGRNPIYLIILLLNLFIASLFPGSYTPGHGWLLLITHQCTYNSLISFIMIFISVMLSSDPHLSRLWKLRLAQLLVPIRD